MQALVGGCSFTSDNNGWQTQLNKKYASITNIAYPAVGNCYIANTIQDHCLAQRWDMVLVMWTGYSRLDIPSVWKQRRENTYEWFVDERHSGSHIEWMCSGGYNAGWRAAKDPDVRELFQRMYVEMDHEHLCYLTLKNILATQQLLKSLDQPYYFMSFINFWNTQRPAQEFRSFYYDDPPASSWPDLQPLIEKIDWDRWICDDDRNGIYERCIALSDLAPDQLHPGNRAQTEWGLKVLQYLERS